jgi:hypothetical protein
LQDKIVNAFRSCVTNKDFSTKSRDPKKRYEEIVSRWRAFGTNRDQLKDEMYQYFHSTEFFQTVKKEILSQLPELGVTESLAQFETVYRSIQKRFPGPFKCTPPPFDPILQGNIPFSWCRLPSSNSQGTFLVRMPTATRDILGTDGKRTASVEITEEFKAYIESMQDRGEKHLYVNLMSLADGHEAIRSNTLVAFGQNHSDACVVISLDKNSPFYTQKNEPVSQAKDEFFDKVLHSLRDPKRYSWPSSLPDDQLRHYQKVAVSLARNLCKGENVLSRHRRCVLLDIVHTEMIRLLTTHYQPTTMNISCRNCIDRGVAQQIEVVAAMSTNPQKEILSKPGLAFTLGSAFLVSNRVMQVDRFARLVSVLDVLLKTKSAESAVDSLRN